MQLILNPGSRSGRGRDLWPIWKSGLRAAGIDYEATVTQGPGDAFRISRDTGADTVIAAGGDGTINEVLDGLMQSARPHRRMGVLYAGTSPDFCRFHGIPTDPRQALQVIVSGRARPVDVFRIEYAGPAGAPRIAHGACSCNVGLGAAVARFANRWRCLLGDRLGTGLGLLGAVALSKPVDLDLEIDGASHALPRTNHLFVLKNPYIASGLRLNASLRPDDGKLRLAALQDRSPLGLCRLIPSFYSGDAHRALFMRDCSHVVIRSAKPREIEFDGDPRGFLPATIRILPRALHLIGDSHDGI